MARAVRALIAEYLGKGGTQAVASRLSGKNGQPRRFDRPSWHAVSPRAGGGLQLQIGTQSFGCLHYRKDFIGCLNCGLASAAAHRLVTSDETVAQIDSALEESGTELEAVSHVCIQGDGSFLSPAEVSKEAAYAVAERLKKVPQVHTVTMETRFDLVQRYLPHILTVKSILAPEKRLEVALGLESASEFVRNVVFRKGSSRKSDILKTLDTLAGIDVDILLYVFVKPALLSEGEALFDAVRTLLFIHSLAARAAHLRWTAALEPSFVQPGTFLEWLYMRGDFLPPYLWSIAEILKASAVGAAFVHLGSPSDYPPPTAIPANRTADGSVCECSPRFYRSLLEYNRHGSVERLAQELPQCDCRSMWAEAVHLDTLASNLERLREEFYRTG